MPQPEILGEERSDERVSSGPPKIGLWSLLAFALWGPDIFISYRRRGGARSYALELRRQLEERRFRCFLDEALLPTGQQVEQYKRAARRSRMFVLVGTASIFTSQHIPIELKAYWDSHRGWLSRRWRRILPINVAGGLDAVADPASKDRWRGTPWETLVGLVSEPETDAAMSSATPSTSVVDRIEQSYSLVRSAVLLLLSTLLVTGTIFGATLYSVRELAAARGQLTTAERELRRTNGRVKLAETRLGQLDGDLRMARRNVEESTRRAREANARRMTAETRAGEAQERQRRAEAQARESIAESLVASGLANVSEDPATAVNLAFTAAQFTDSLAPASLLREAIERNPVWYRNIPTGADPERWSLSASSDPNDRIATNRDMNVLLTILQADNEDAPSKLGLLRVPSGEVLSQRMLERNERVLTPQPLTTRLVAIARGDREEARIFDLEKKNLTTPVLEAGRFRGIAFAGGGWPCFVLTPNGTVDRYDEPVHGESSRKQLSGQWPDAQAIFAHPQGLSLVITKSDEIIWLAFGQDRGIKESAVIPWPRPVPALGSHVEFDIRWGPSPDRFLAADKGAFLIVRAVHAPSGQIQELYSARSSGGLEPPIFDTAREGRRFIVGAESVDEENEKVEVFDVRWSDEMQEDVVEVRRVAELVGSRPGSTFGFLQAAVISPNGNYVVVSRSQALTSGTTNMTGLIESWELGSIDWGPSSLNPLAVELKTGRNPVVRLAYSADSSRLLAWEDAGIAHVFWLRMGPPPSPWEQRVRTPEELETRFDAEPEPVDRAGRFRRVTYSPQDVRYYDLVTGREIPLQKWTAGNTILDSSLSDDASGLRIVTENELLEVRGQSLTRRIQIGSRVARAHLAEDVGLIEVGRELRILAPRSLNMIGSVTLEDTMEPTWIWANHQNQRRLWVYALLKDGRFLAWQLFSEGAGGRLREASRVETRLGEVEEGGHFAYRVIDDVAIFFAQNRVGTAVKFHDLIHGRELAFDPPPGWGWPSHASGLRRLFRLENDRLMLLLNYRKQGEERLVAAIWRKTGGHCISAVALGRSGEIFQTFSGSPGDIHLLVKDDSGLARVRTHDGKVLWSSNNILHRVVPPPLVQDATGRWQALDSAEYRKVAQRITLGGMSSARDITYVEMPEFYRKRIALLTQRGETSPGD